MNKKNMYIVIKREDAQKYLSNDEIKKLVGMLEKISDGRMEDNKHPSNTYLFGNCTTFSCIVFFILWIICYSQFAIVFWIFISFIYKMTATFTFHN